MIVIITIIISYSFSFADLNNPNIFLDKNLPHFVLLNFLFKSLRSTTLRETSPKLEAVEALH